MTTDTLTLTDFLLERIAEDEESISADKVGRHWPDPIRSLAECRAKRRIVEWHKSWPVLVQQQPTFEQVGSDDPSQITMRASQQIAWLTEQEYRSRFGDEPPTAPVLAYLAAVYAGHSDYRDEWRISG